MSSNPGLYFSVWDPHCTIPCLLMGPGSSLPILTFCISRGSFRMSATGWLSLVCVSVSPSDGAPLSAKLCLFTYFSSLTSTPYSDHEEKSEVYPVKRPVNIVGEGVFDCENGQILKYFSCETSIYQQHRSKPTWIKFQLPVSAIQGPLPSLFRSSKRWKRKLKKRLMFISLEHMTFDDSHVKRKTWLI